MQEILVTRSRLSVSSIGTNELQPTVKRDCVARSVSFQFPLSERTNCNFFDLLLLVNEWNTFSFLYRNERTATTHDGIHRQTNAELSVSSIGTNELQPSQACAAESTVTLSVSSIGTNELQHVRKYKTHFSHSTFSFLYRNERTATRFIFIASHTPCYLSVSSIGTNELQQKRKPGYALPMLTLSVSSIGTNELQQNTAIPCSRLTQTFSFLYRNERTATAERPHQSPCRIQLSVSSIGTNELQLPLLFKMWRFRFAFSFLYRNERTATFSDATTLDTSVALSVSSIGTNELQPVFLVFVRHFPCGLSVSSIGTNELQQLVERVIERPHIFLSVSSIGTNELQLGSVDRVGQRGNLSVSSIGTNELQPVKSFALKFAQANFQFPLSERTNCNKFLCPRR